MSCVSLLRLPEKYDRKPVWVVGTVSFKDGTAYLSAEPGTAKKYPAEVCLEPVASFTGSGPAAGLDTLRRFEGVSVGVHGRYQKDSSSECPNSTIFVALLEMSLE